MFGIRVGRAVALLMALLAGASALRGQQSPQENALWLAESAGVLKLATTDGHILLNIGGAASARAIAVDHHRGSVWFYASRTLYSYSFAGTRQLTVSLTSLPISLPLIDVPDTDLAVFEDDGSAWLAVGRNLLAISSSGQQLHALQLSESIESLAVDQKHAILWVATSHGGAAYDAVTGSVLRSIALAGIQSIDVDPLTSVLWVAWRDGIRSYTYDGTLMRQIALRHATHVAADLKGGAWASTATELRRIGPAGQTLATLRPFGLLESVVALAVDPSNDSLWAASELEVAQVSGAGQRLRVFGFFPPIRIWDLALYADLIPPSLSIRTPQEGAYLGTSRPAFEFLWSDLGSGVDSGSLALRANGSPLAVSCSSSDSGATCTATNSLPDGPVTASATVKDRAGNVSDPATVSFTIDTAPPNLLVTLPANGTLTNQKNQSFVGTISEPGTVTINGAAATVAPDNSFTATVPLQEGVNAVVCTVRDRAGNTSQLTVTVTLDTVPPTPLDPSRAVVAAGTNGTVTVSASAGSVEPGASVILTNTRTGSAVTATATPDGSFSAGIAGQAGDVLSIVLKDAAGNRSASANVTVPGSSDPGLPPDPSTLATPLDRTVATDIASATAFLYSGDSPIQAGVAPGVIDPKRVAVLRGRILDRNGFPLPGARIKILDHAELGSTISRADGAYDLAVNGGGTLTLTFEKPGFLSIQRQVQAPWRDYVAIDDAILVALDSAVTVITSGAPTIQVAQGSAVDDEDGRRRATILFPAGVTAAMVRPDGTREPLSTLSVRATEYTVGANGPRAMPGPLPATVGYTWAAELSVDEAIAAGAERVEFSSPVTLYVDNFLHFPTGTIVPVGFYDRVAAAWIGAPNGQVVAIVGRDSGGRALLDLDGSGQPANAEALAALSITDEERQKLGTLFEPGQSFWRAPVAHFSPHDLNLPPAPLPEIPSDAEAPPEDDPAEDEGAKDDDNDCTSGSIIECQSQVLGEQVNLVGTPFSLSYRSDQTPGRTALYTAKIAVSGPVVPPSLKRIDLEVEIAGRTVRQSFPPQPNQTYTFTWDGKDAYGRLLQGSAPLTTKKTYAYALRYAQPGEGKYSWGLYPDASYTLIGDPRQTSEIDISRTHVQQWVEESSRMSLGGWDARAMGLGGWRLDVHHSYDPASHTLYLGTGERRSAYSLPPLLYRTAGTGEAGFSGDGGQASLAQMADPSGIAMAADGTLYIADQSNHRIRRVSPDGIISTVAGDGTPREPDPDGGPLACGDGGPAISAHLRSPQAVAVGSDGALWIADTDDNCVRRVDPSGTIQTAVGTCDGGGGGRKIVARGASKSGAKILNCEGCQGTEIDLSSPTDLAMAPDGGLYIADSQHDRVLFLDRAGRITTAAGGGNPPDGLGDGGSARDAAVFHPQGLSLGRDGSLYIAQPYQDLVRRVTPDGRITTVAGSGLDGYCGDGGPAASACLSFPTRVAATPDGGFLIADTNDWLVRRVTADGVISTISGTAEDKPSFTTDGPAATSIFLEPVEAMAVAPDGSFYLATAEAVFRQSKALPSFTGGQITIPSQDGKELYVFDSTGRHLRTIDPLTRAVLYAFDYDAKGLLTSIHDVDGKLTRVERGAAGNPTALVGPFGQRTVLGVDGNGYLNQVTNPAGEGMSFTYDENGLLLSSRDPRGSESHYQYAGFGSLVQAQDRAGAQKTLLRTNGFSGLYFVNLTSGAGRQTRYQTQRFDNGSRFVARRDPTGEITVNRWEQDGSQKTFLPDGSSVILTPAPDPRWGLIGPIAGSLKLSTPSGLTREVSTQRSVLLTNSNDPLALGSIVDTVSMNGRDFVSTYDAATRRFTLRTPEGREQGLSIDSKGHPSTIEIAGLFPIELGYDDLGRLVSMARGAGNERRVVTFEYDDKGWLTKVSGPLSRSVQLEHDEAGRILSQIDQDGRTVSFTYDPNGNLTALTPPGKPLHQFDFTPVDLLATYNPPALGTGAAATNYSYNLDQQLTHVGRTDGRSVDLSYDTAGRLETVGLSAGALRLSYDSATGHLASLSSTDGETIGYAYDGLLPTSATWSGPVRGSVTRTYDDSFRLVSTSVNGADPISLQYDQDDLLAQAGSLTLQRDAANGLLTGTALREITTAQSYNAFGELTGFQASFGATPFYSEDHTYDQLGRITEKVETLGNVTTILDYHYDSAGRLADVAQNGTAVAHYDYDDNGNRTSEAGPAGPVTSLYDAQDRLIQHGDVTYTYSANGELATKTQDGAVVTYSYDELGSLRQVGLPSGITIDYVIDGRGRRVGKRVNGTLVQGFLYKDLLHPAAELDGAGQVVSRFVYGSRPHVPDYLVKGGITYRIISDHLGSPRLIVDSETGEVVQRLDYDAFGRVTLDTNPGFQPFGFAGGLYDYQTGLVRFGARDYDAEVGRWLTKDPTLTAGNSANLYSYCFNDPVNFLDPDGKVAIADDLALAGAATAFGPVGDIVAGGIIIGVGVAVLWEVYHNPIPPPIIDPVQHIRPWNKPGAPGKICPPPTAIPGQRPRTTPAPPLVNVDPAADPKPTPTELWDNEEKKSNWDKVIEGVADWLSWLGG